MFFKWLFLLIVLVSSYIVYLPQLFSQERRIQIVDEKGTVIPYLCLKSLETGNLVLSGMNGDVVIKSDEFKMSDTLQVVSLFYENIKIALSNLDLQLQVTIPYHSQILGEVVVYPAKTLENILERLSSHFAQLYAKDYAAKLLHLRTVEAEGKYREFCGYQGIFSSFDFTQQPVSFFWEDRNKFYWAPLTVMRSNPYMSNRDKSLEVSFARGIPSVSQLSKEYLKVRFLNAPSHDPLMYKRSFEMYSPLNQKQLKNYTYEIIDEYKNDLNQKIIVIRFTTKFRSYPNKTRLFGSGNIYYNVDLEYAERICMENHQDQYSMFPRLKVKGPMNLATRHIVDVCYCIRGENIYTKSVSLDVQWVDPTVEDHFYYIKESSRRNPIKYKLHEYEYLAFSDFILLTKERKETIRPLMDQAVLFNLVYAAQFERSKWENIDYVGIDRNKLFNDLNINNCSIYEQAKQNALDTVYYYSGKELKTKQINHIQTYYAKTRDKLYPLLYHEKYK